LGVRDWSRLARWTHRQFNELPHEFEQRLHEGAEYAREYIGQFPSKYLDIIGACLAPRRHAPESMPPQQSSLSSA